MFHFPRWKIILVLGIALWGFVYSSPNVINPDILAKLPSFMPKETVSLGLDLQGGSHLLMQVEIDVVVKDRIESMMDDARKDLRKERIGYNNLARTENGFSLTLRDVAQTEEARKIIRRTDVNGLDITDDEKGKVTAVLNKPALIAIKQSAISQSIEIVRRRIDAMGTKEPIIQAQGSDRILLQLPGVDNPEQIKNLLGKTARMTFHMVDTEVSAVSGIAPAGTQKLPMKDGGHIVIKKRSLLTGEMLTDAQTSFDDSGRPAVSFRFNSAGARRFGDVTSANIGKPFAIVLDGQVITAPTIQSAITGGSGIITGNFTTEEATELSVLLRAGALPAPLTVIEERSVGPSLGADSIEAGKMAGIISTLIVFAFMAICYSLFGIFACISLCVNISLMFAILSALGATLTMPGIAGIVLTIGMAVDIHVLINERIREEIAAGRSPLIAIEKGYQEAMSSIWDANITTLISAVLLYNFGTGPIRGFAVTLAIGVLTSLYTGIWLTHLMTVLWIKSRKRVDELPI